MKALLIVDMQNDFMEGGALPIVGARALIPCVNRLQANFDLIVASRDWHPANHCSFASNHPGKRPGESIKFAGCEQILWPAHCVQDTVGAEFVAELEKERWAKVFSKGTDPHIDSYSAFFDNAKRRSTGLTEYLKAQRVTEVYFVGVATEYCVKFSVLDALELGFQAAVIRDAVGGIHAHAGDVDKAFVTMREAGCRTILSANLVPDQ